MFAVVSLQINEWFRTSSVRLRVYELVCHHLASFQFSINKNFFRNYFTVNNHNYLLKSDEEKHNSEFLRDPRQPRHFENLFNYERHRAKAAREKLQTTCCHESAIITN